MVSSLREFAAELVQTGLYPNEDIARKAVLGWIGRHALSAGQVLAPVKSVGALTPGKARAILQGLRATGRVVVQLPEPTWFGTDRVCLAWLTDVIAALRSLTARPEPSTRDDPAWRRVRRSLQEEIEEKLTHSPLVALVGMSGMGKTLLAQQVFEVASGPKAWFAAPRPDPCGFTEVTQTTLAHAVLAFLGQHAIDHPGGPEAVVRDLTALTSELAADVCAAEARRDPVSIQRDITHALASARRTTANFVQAILPFTQRAQGVALLARLCRVLAQCLRRNQTHLLVIDDAWHTDRPWPLINALLPPPAAASWPVRVLVTSQERSAAFTRDPAAIKARTLELDRNENNKAGFARSLVAAWGALRIPTIAAIDSD